MRKLLVIYQEAYYREKEVIEHRIDEEGDQKERVFPAPSIGGL